MSDEERIASVLGAWRERMDEGDDVDPEELFEAHPDLAPALRERFRALAFLDASLRARPTRSAARLSRPSPERYVDFEVAGKGGMGIVYRALDTDLHRPVALKVVRPLTRDEEAEGSGPMELSPPVRQSPEHHAFEELTARFLQEVWVTGGLEHPGIVPVHEVGQTPAGVPYYTMRLVEGERTLETAIEEAEGIEQRLGLLEPFLKVCDTVAYAHARGILHRDLKPVNVALGAFGEVVVLDWGLAKVRSRPDLSRGPWRERIGKHREARDLRTASQALGTLGYMAPEAALGRVKEMDERSDVYGLGAILYRILTGRLPFTFSTYAELVGKLDSRTPRGASEVDRRVPEGLAAICARALASDREERLASVGELAGAIRTWQRESEVEREVVALLREAKALLDTAEELKGAEQLRGLDGVAGLCARVLALRVDHPRADELTARAEKIRERGIRERERAARGRLLRRVAAAGLVVATAATVLVAVLLDGKRREAEEARGREASERARAEDLGRFMLSDMKLALEELGRLDLLEAVAKKARAYYEALPGEPTDETRRARALALTHVGDVLLATGETEEALALFERLVTIFEALASSDATGRAASVELAGALLKVGHARVAEGALGEALERYEASLDIARGVAAARTDDDRVQMLVADTLRYVARVQTLLGMRADALRSFEESMEIKREFARADPDDGARQHGLLVGLLAVAEVQTETGQADKALETALEALSVADRLVAEDSRNLRWVYDRARALRLVGSSHLAAWRLPEAETHLRHSADILERLTDLEPSNVRWRQNLAVSLRGLAIVLHRTRKPAQALDLYGRVATMLRRLIERDERNVNSQMMLASVLNGEGLVLTQARRFPEALARIVEARDIVHRLSANCPENRELAETLSICWMRVAELRTVSGEPAEALRGYERSLAVIEPLAETDPEEVRWQVHIGYCLEKIGDLHLAAQDYDAALRAFRRSVVIEERRGPEDPSGKRGLATSLARIGAVHVAQGRHEDALPMYRRSEAITQALVSSAPGNPTWRHDLAIWQWLVGETLESLGRIEEAAAHLERALATEDEAVRLEPRYAAERDQLAAYHRRVALAAGIIAPRTANDHAEKAVTLQRAQRHLEAARSFETALEDDAVRADLGRSHLYNGACAAARASEIVDGAEAARWRECALGWLAEDLRDRREALARVEGQLAVEKDPARTAELGRARQSLLEHLAHARTEDPDLAPLRALPAFRALFDEDEEE